MEEKIMHLLITEDDMALAQGLQRALQEKNRQVLCCKNIQETRQHLHQNKTDLLILDVNLPDGSGFDLLQEIRRTSDLPVILLTANDLEMDIVSGLEQGANDYITKPFSLAVLRARVNTQLRNWTAQMQKESAKNTQIWEGSIWKFDFTNMRFTVSGQEVELSKTEQKLLALLVQHVGMTVPRETLMDRIWTDSELSVRSIDGEREKIKELIADISHQTRTPLSNILLYTELLEEEPLGEAAQDSVKKLRQQSEKLQFLIDALVKLSRLETGVFVLHPKRQPLTELVIDCMESYREKAAAQGLSIAFAGTKKAEEDAPVYAYFDKKWSMEAMGNILDNAIKYTNTGGITIKLCSYELFACVEVTDTGIGIGEEEHAAVFRRFYRGNAVAEKSGVGIGLYLARSIMQQQDGYIRLSSTPGEGSTFGLYFPTAIVSKL